MGTLALRDINTGTKISNKRVKYGYEFHEVLTEE
jgi:hypothetical protein